MFAQFGRTRVCICCARNVLVSILHFFSLMLGAIAAAVCRRLRRSRRQLTATGATQRWDTQHATQCKKKVSLFFIRIVFLVELCPWLLLSVLLYFSFFAYSLAPNLCHSCVCVQWNSFCRSAPSQAHTHISLAIAIHTRMLYTPPNTIDICSDTHTLCGSRLDYNVIEPNCECGDSCSLVIMITAKQLIITSKLISSKRLQTSKQMSSRLDQIRTWSNDSDTRFTGLSFQLTIDDFWLITRTLFLPRCSADLHRIGCVHVCNWIQIKTQCLSYTNLHFTHSTRTYGKTEFHFTNDKICIIVWIRFKNQ